jgi:hypothetical protein
MDRKMGPLGWKRPHLLSYGTIQMDTHNERRNDDAYIYIWIGYWPARVFARSKVEQGASSGRIRDVSCRSDPRGNTFVYDRYQNISTLPTPVDASIMCDDRANGIASIVSNSLAKPTRYALTRRLGQRHATTTYDLPSQNSYMFRIIIHTSSSSIIDSKETKYFPAQTNMNVKNGSKPFWYGHIHLHSLHDVTLSSFARDISILSCSLVHVATTRA